MKKIFLILTILLMPAICFCAGGGRFSDRDWSVTSVTLNAAAKRVTIPRSGSLWIQAQGADCFIDFNSTANISSILISDGGSIDFWPANITYGEYFTLYSASTATLNYIIMD